MNSKKVLTLALAGSLFGGAMLAAQAPATPPIIPAAHLTEFERSLVGAWYFTGDAGQPCYVTCTNNMVFMITQELRAARIKIQPDGTFLAEDYEPGLHAMVKQDAILWSNGTWWSRQPMATEAAPH